MSKVLKIFFNLVPILFMIGLIPVIANDYTLTAVYVVLIIIALIIERGQRDLVIFIFGFLIMIFLEYLFVSTGVETFNRNSLFGLIPLWLPFLWGYGFVAIKRVVGILGTG